MTAPQRVYLDAFLAPLAEFLERDDVTDLYINRPGEVWLDTAAGTQRHYVPALDDASLWRLARQIAASSDQGINREHPLLASTLPDPAFRAPAATDACILRPASIARIPRPTPAPRPPPARPPRAPGR